MPIKDVARIMGVDDKASDPSAGGAEASTGHRRAAARDSLFLLATLSHAGDAASITARVRNLSAEGMMVETTEAFARGDRIEIELRGIGSLTGKVAWREDGRLGVAFDSRIDPMKARKALPNKTTAPPAPRPIPAPKRRKLFGD